jgi:predicted adenine nucleotide alpha hydrolase (AANH) superfamily ATPase
MKGRQTGRPAKMEKEPSKVLLLHICCAPDATVPWPELLKDGLKVKGFFYGGNVQPESEYERRTEALRKLCGHLGAEAAIMPFDMSEWLRAVRGLEDEPEGGKRCEACFSLQLEAAASYAEKNGFTELSTTLTISPHKDPNLINEIGERAAGRHGLTWIGRVWRKNGGFQRSVTESRRLGLYRQNYCGCIPSLKSRMEQS